MDEIQSSLEAFQNLLHYTYYFTIAYKKELHNIKLTFYEEDFRHCAGLQYLKDIDIPKHSDRLFKAIASHKITDDFLSQSRFYKNMKDSYAKVQRRIYGLQFLETYLDSKNLVFQFVQYMNRYSVIDAEYLIKSTVNHITAYIFIRQRKQSDEYCICSFFIDSEQSYDGIKAYWMRKIKMNNITKDVIVLLDRLTDTPHS